MVDIPAVVAFASVFVLGICFSVIGSVKLKLAEVLQIDDAKVGGLISALMFCSLIAVLIIGPAMDKLGYMIIATLGFLLAGLCIWMLAGAKNYTTAFVACLLLGIGAMCVNTAGNVLGPTVLFGGENPAAASNLLNVFFGIGAFITPLIAAALLGRVGYSKTVAVIGAICFAPIILALKSSYPPAPPGFNVVRSIGLISEPGVLLGGICLLFYIGLEASMGGFITTYLKSHELSDERANTILSGFWICLMIARLIAAFVLLGVPEAQRGVAVVVLSLIAAIAIGIMIGARTPAHGIIGTLLAGLSFGPLFPTIVGVTFTKTAAIKQGITGSVFGWIFAIGLLGGIIIPALVGRYSAKLSIRQSITILLVVAILLLVFASVLQWAVPITVVE
jgi:fucose permease